VYEVHKRRRISVLDGKLLASQEQLISMPLFDDDDDDDDHHHHHHHHHHELCRSRLLLTS
jgi:hypothetical protein